MPLERYRDTDEARRALWVQRGDPTLAARIRSLWSFARRLAPGAAPRGLRRFASPAEAQREREDWSRRRALALRQSRWRP